MSRAFKSFGLYPEPFAESLVGCMTFTPERRASFIEGVLTGELLSEAALHGSEMRLTGMVVSAVLEGELVHFLKTRRGNCRNGYVPRHLHLPSGDVDVLLSRDRRGEFEPRFLQTYSRTLNLDEQDLLAFVVAEGYSEEEKRQLLEAAYRSVGAEVPESFEALFATLNSEFGGWNDGASPQYVKLAAGWDKRVKHENGIEKLIVGICALDFNGHLVGMRAVAGRPDESFELVDRLIRQVAQIQGVLAPMIFVAPEGSEAFAQSVRRYWPLTEIISARTGLSQASGLRISRPTA